MATATLDFEKPILELEKQISKRSGSEFARLTVEDFTGSTEVLVFPEKWAAIGDQVKTDVPVLIKGGYSRRDRDADAPTFIIESIQRFADITLSGQLGIAITIGGTELPAEILRDVRVIVESHSTASTEAPFLEVRWKPNGGAATTFRSRSLRVPASLAVRGELRALLG